MIGYADERAQFVERHGFASRGIGARALVAIFFIRSGPGRRAQPISERALRDSVLKSLDWLKQRRRWAELRGAWSTVST